jgi:hypothetical protein
MAPQSVCFGMRSRKLSNVGHWMSDQNVLSRASPRFERHVKPLVPAVFAVVSTHQTALGYGPFFLCVLHKESLCPSSGDINRLMMNAPSEAIIYNKFQGTMNDEKTHQNKRLNSNNLIFNMSICMDL